MTTPSVTASVSETTPIPARPTLYSVAWPEPSGWRVSNAWSTEPIRTDARLNRIGAVIVTIPASAPESEPKPQSGEDWREQARHALYEADVALRGARPTLERAAASTPSTVGDNGPRALEARRIAAMLRKQAVHVLSLNGPGVPKEFVDLHEIEARTLEHAARTCERPDLDWNAAALDEMEAFVAGHPTSSPPPSHPAEQQVQPPQPPKDEAEKPDLVARLQRAEPNDPEYTLRALLREAATALAAERDEALKALAASEQRERVWMEKFVRAAERLDDYCMGGDRVKESLLDIRADLNESANAARANTDRVVGQKPASTPGAVRCKHDGNRPCRWIDLRREGDTVIVEYTVDGVVVGTIRENIDCNFSHGMHASLYEDDARADGRLPATQPVEQVGEDASGDDVLAELDVGVEMGERQAHHPQRDRRSQ